MKIMAKNSSATVREHTPHVLETSRTNTIVNALKRRAQAVLNDESLDAQGRAIIRYAMETNDPWLAEIVRRADAGESVIETVQDLATRDSRTSEPDEHHFSANGYHPDQEQNGEKVNEELQQKIEALAAIVCLAGGEAAAALFVLMGTLENSTHPKALANTAKQFAYARCNHLNLYGMVDGQIVVGEGKLLTVSTPMS
jgi:hypothetical protein